jgi:hypothetical protein
MANGYVVNFIRTVREHADTKCRVIVCALDKTDAAYRVSNSYVNEGFCRIVSVESLFLGDVWDLHDERPAK